MTMPPPNAPDAPGDGLPRIGRYELVGELASGGMAVVFLARLAGVGGFQRLFALKRLHPHLARETEFVAMFLDEARLAASVRDAHAVPILEVGISEAGDHFVVMEYVEGASLAVLIATATQQQGWVPTGAALRITLDALAGLHAAHEARDERGEPLGIVHRDVSPHNVLVGVDGVARLTDFGIARAASRLTSTRDGAFKGKLSYMAPEQAGGEEVDRRADVFAAAVIAWELLANRRLFRGTNDLHTVHLLLYEPIPLLGEFHPGAPPALEAALARALDRDPGARFATAAEFAEAIEHGVAGWSAPASARDLAAFVESTAARTLARQREIWRSSAPLPTTLRAGLALPSWAPPPSSTPPALSPSEPTGLDEPIEVMPPAARTARNATLEGASTSELEAALQRRPVLSRLAALGVGAAIAALAALGYRVLQGDPRGPFEGAPPVPSQGRSAAPEPVTSGPARPSVTGWPGSASPPEGSAPVLSAISEPSTGPALSAAPGAPPAPSSSAETTARPKPPRPPSVPPPRPAGTPAGTSQTEYPGLNPYR